MKICYPFRDTNGKEFQSQEAVMRLIDGEAHGSWLLGANGLWHGGIHISDVSNPFSVLIPDAVNTGDPVPLQFMADGVIVAYRINHEYLTAPYCGKALRYSSSFVLVKSQCKPDPEKENTWLDFYSLYMHLAPIADYPVSPCYKVKSGHNGIPLRQYVRGQNGLPDGENEGSSHASYPAPKKTNKSLNAGDRVVCLRTGRFYVTKSGKSVLETFGLVRLLKENNTSDEHYWVTLNPALMEQDGEIAALLPGWMAQAQAKGSFDAVVLTEGCAAWKVRAGKPVGFMGCMESPDTESTQVDKEWYVHLEVLSADPKMPGLLSNPGNVKTGKKIVRAPKGKQLSIRLEHSTQAFSPISAKLGAQCVMDKTATTAVQDEARQVWYQVSGSGWLPQNEVEEIEQYDLLRQGFLPLEENSRGDVMNSAFEDWIPAAFGTISQAAEQGADHKYYRVPPFYRNLMAKIDSKHDGKVTSEEIRQALTVRDPLVKDVVTRLVVKHHSEWFGGRSTGLWEGFYQDLDPLEVKYCEKWQSDLEWMSKVPPFNKGEPVWHFHPVMFLDSLNNSSCNCEELYADKFKVTKYGKIYGPIYKGEISLKDYSRWDILIASGKLTLDEKEILIAMSENEGNMDAIQSYDSEVITAGAMQKTIKDEFNPNSKPKIDLRGRGELSSQLGKFRDLHPALYNKYSVGCGWTAEGSSSSAIIYYNDSILTKNEKITATELKTLIRQGCSEKTYGKTIHNKPLAALLKIITLPEYLDLQVLDFIERLHSAESNIVNGNNKIKDYVKSKFGRAIVLDHSVNRPGYVKDDFKKAIGNFYKNNAAVSDDPALWGGGFNNNEQKLLDEYKKTRRMTDSINRYNLLKAKL